ncbi:MAG: hypothetical protein ABIQ64_00915 [Candidatus Saccharimonadales bacterium]
MTPKVCGGLSTATGATQLNYDQFGPDLIFHKVAWSSVSPNTNPASGGTYNWSAIDGNMSTYSASRYTLRIQAGDDAPGWLKTAAGSINLYNTARAQTANCCMWWKQEAKDAWLHMINAAGARYDSDPRVVIVSADLPMVVYSEPWILGNDDPSAIDAFNNGLTLNVQRDVIKWCIDVTAAAFPNTLVEIAIHEGFQYPTAAGCVTSIPIGRDLAHEIALAHGKHVIMTDYGLGVPDTAAAHVTGTGDLSTKNDVYDWMNFRSTAAAGAAQGPIGFQLTPNGQTSSANYVQMAQNAVDLGGWECETSGWGSMPSAEITRLDNALKANAAEGWPIAGGGPPPSSLEPVGVFTGGNDGGTSNVTTQTLTLPAAAAVGDVAIVMSTAFSTTATATLASGSAGSWTLLSGPDASFTGSNYREYLWAKTLAAGDIGSSVVITWSAQLAGLAVGVVYPAGCTIGPNGFATVTGGSSAITPTGVAATAGDALLLFVTAKANSGATPATATLPGTATSDKVSATASVAGTNFGTVAAHQPVDTTGTVGNTSITFSVATNGASAYTLVLSPPASTTGLPVFLRSGGSWVAKRLVRVP